MKNFHSFVIIVGEYITQTSHARAKPVIESMMIHQLNLGGLGYEQMIYGT
jgi:hypothetical protein